MKRISIFILCLLLAAGAAATFVAPPPASVRTDWTTNRYALPAEGLLVWDYTTADVNDTSISVDPNLSGYLQRVIFSADGNDGTWSLTVSDAAGIALFSRTDCNMVNDPCSYVCDYALGGLPFSGGLSVAIADANDGDGNNISLRFYLREAWRR